MKTKRGRRARTAVVAAHGLALLLLAGVAGAQTFTFTQVAGNPGGAGFADGTGTGARFNGPIGIAVDGAGNQFVADTRNHTIRKITAAGAVTTFAGLTGSPGSTDGNGPSARFSQPAGVAVDHSGTVYVADAGNHTLRTIAPDGTVSTLAGLAGSPGSADGNGSAARFNGLSGVAVDGSGNVYVGDQGNNTIRTVSSDRSVATLAGLAGAFGSSDGTGSAARFNRPSGVAVDGSGNVFVGDEGNERIRRVSPRGSVTTLVGTGICGGFYPPFSCPWGVAVDGSGNVYVADSVWTSIKKVTPDGTVTALAGFGQGAEDGTGSAARFYFPRGIAIDPHGDLFVADTGNNAIRKVTAAGVVTTVAGALGWKGTEDGTGSAARFNWPEGLAVDGAGNLYVADEESRTIRKITPGGAVTTLAGLGGASGSADGEGSAARFWTPQGVAVDASGNVYVADYQAIRKITPDRVVTTFAGRVFESGHVDGPGVAARFGGPHGVATDGSGNVYVADTGNHTVRKITPGGVVTTVAGLAGAPGSEDGIGSAARFNGLQGVAVDVLGSVYVADSSNRTIRRVTPDGVVTTLAGLAWNLGSADGTGSAARFQFPKYLTVDRSGNVYVTDQANQTIRRITPDGTVTTVGGLAGYAGSQDGTGSAALFADPSGIAVDASGTLWISDRSDSSIRKGTPSTRSLLLSRGRVLVTVEWRNQYSGESGTAYSSPQQDRFGFFYFTDPNNPELFVKVLDFGGGGALCFVGGLTDLHYRVTFTVVQTSQQLVFEKPAGAYVGFSDNGTLKFGRPGVPGVSSKANTGDAVSVLAGFLPLGEDTPARASISPAAAQQSLTLSRDRVQVVVEWRSQYSGQSGIAYGIPQQDGFGFFYFTDPSNPEVFVKVLDFGEGGALCFVGGLSDFYYKVTFKVLRTGQTLVFEKPAGLYLGFADNGSLRF